MKHLKRLFAVLMAVALIGSLSACGNAAAAGEPKEPAATNSGTEAAVPDSSQAAETDDDEAAAESAGPQEAETLTDSNNTEETADSNILVVYFSRTGEQYTVGVIDHGNTAIVAEMIAEETGADLFEVLPEDDHYPMTYAELTDVAKQEQNENARPAYAGEVPDLSQYDTVFIGSPVWWGDWPMIMYTFFEENADMLAGKTLVPFSTHEGSGLSGFDRKLEGACPGATIGTGLAVRGNDCQNAQEKVRESVSGWLTELGL